MFMALAVGMFQTASGVSPLRSNSNEPDPATVKQAVESFRNLSKKERTLRIKEAKSAIKEFKAKKSSGTSDAAEINTLLLVLITILIPPLGVYLHQGEINSKFWISLLLTLLFYVPGLIYSLIVVLGSPSSAS